MRTFVVSVLAAAVIIGTPVVAHADGGAFISLDHTYYVAGDTAVATAYVAIPKSQRSLLTRGPFYGYVLDNRDWIRAGRPVPAQAVRVGPFLAHPERGWFEFETSFTVPSLSPGWHHLSFCNDPCTIDGFREPLRGQFSVVETEREAELLIENGRLHGQLSAARRDATKADERLEVAQQDLESAEREAARRTDEASVLRTQLAAAQDDAAAARARAAMEHRAALIVGAELLLGVIAVVVLRRMRRYRGRTTRTTVAT